MHVQARAEPRGRAGLSHAVDLDRATGLSGGPGAAAGRGVAGCHAGAPIGRRHARRACRRRCLGCVRPGSAGSAGGPCPRTCRRLPGQPLGDGGPSRWRMACPGRLWHRWPLAVVARLGAARIAARSRPSRGGRRGRLGAGQRHAVPGGWWGFASRRSRSGPDRSAQRPHARAAGSIGRPAGRGQPVGQLVRALPGRDAGAGCRAAARARYPLPLRQPGRKCCRRAGLPAARTLRAARRVARPGQCAGPGRRLEGPADHVVLRCRRTSRARPFRRAQCSQRCRRG